MISYTPGTWGVGFIFSLVGSVFPKAAVWAVPNALLAVGLLLNRKAHVVADLEMESMEGVADVWSSYTLVLAFLLVFRSNQAFTRFWEGTTSTAAVHSMWTNAAGTLMSFSSQEPEKLDQVRRFQHLAVRLLSLLFCSAMQDVCQMEDDSMEIIDPRGINAASLRYFKKASVEERPEILIQWLYRAVVDAQKNGILVAAPPCLNRAFMEISRGRVMLQNIRVLSDMPFPFPYAQMITTMLIVHWVVMPLLASQLIESVFWCGTVCFVVTLVLWSLLYIALQIDQPFGDDHTDLPVKDTMKQFNQSLLTMMRPEAQLPPKFGIAALGDKPNLMRSWSTQ
eukprot:TRINITY_DN87124_c0_g1_i1.p1 TRINITY_DN87124_c0_g1~~TRINITY_DN87124_c0_g1_i1.p1  ORF type:complete len:338 (-),score=47.04 TRINITY_DN87124_c0_g1_i1:66-1079(-)